MHTTMQAHHKNHYSVQLHSKHVIATGQQQSFAPTATIPSMGTAMSNTPTPTPPPNHASGEDFQGEWPADADGVISSPTAGMPTVELRQSSLLISASRNILLVFIGLWCGYMVLSGISKERTDLGLDTNSQLNQEPGMSILLRQRERNNDSHQQLTVFVTQDAILYHAQANPAEWVTIPSGSNLHIMPNVERGYLITSRALSKDLHWQGGHIRLIPDRHNQLSAILDNDTISGQEDIFKTLDPLNVEALDGRSVFAISGRNYLGSLLVHWQNARNVVAINHIGIEGYVGGVLQSELNVTWPLEALKAQAVISRSYGYSKMLAGGQAIDDIRFDVRDSIADQDYQGTGNGGVKIDWATKSTRGQILSTAGIPFAPFFHAASGGQLAAIDDVFPNSSASNGRQSLDQVMVAKEDPFYIEGLSALNKENTHGKRTYSISSGELRNLLRNSGEQVGWILRMTAERHSSGHVTTVGLGWAGGEKTMSGAAFRTLVGANRLRSTLWSNSSPSQSEGTFVIESTGWGHGVGLSQISMYAMAHLHRYLYPDILSFFYQNTTIERLW